MLPSKLRQWMSLSILTIGLLSTRPLRASAQQSNVSCLAEYGWMDNSIGQDPCLVSAFLQGACTGGQFDMSSLGPGAFYAGPCMDEINPCECNTITYNLIAACSICQNQTYIRWSTWSANCATVYPGVYPVTIPFGTAIPHWAYQDVTKTDDFNATIAQLAGDAPESTATHTQATSTAVISTTPPASITLGGNTGTQSPTPTPSSSKSNTGMIVGVAVGGTVAAGAIAVLITWLYVRRRRRQTRALSGDTLSTPTSAFADPATQLKLYDPSDPCTFPVSPPTIYMSPFFIHQNNTIHSNVRAAQGGHPITYSGAPELQL
ncbi:hypothetical protein SCLCIDRAFT_849521 [Scleroderma citrinum Foug A]|uniref:Mid2 domain-containing protein n=1 Tax=Scleroderma citrinum Foug A TaxID=1036808 RepID=A0A0C3E0Z9_9AGAM|nr:hypothetical protein SCLCIDRAFT_849521 [Scleroderma citrinum Foug A]